MIKTVTGSVMMMVAQGGSVLESFVLKRVCFISFCFISLQTLDFQ